MRERLRGPIGRWVMRIEAAEGLLRSAFLAVTAASTLTSALIAAGYSSLAPIVLACGVIGTPALAWGYVEGGIFNRKNRERMDRGDNFAGPGMAMGTLIRADQLAAAVEALDRGEDPQERVRKVTHDRLREFRDGIDVDDVFDPDELPNVSASENGHRRGEA